MSSQNKTSGLGQFSLGCNNIHVLPQVGHKLVGTFEHGTIIHGLKVGRFLLGVIGLLGVISSD